MIRTGIDNAMPSTSSTHSASRPNSWSAGIARDTIPSAAASGPCRDIANSLTWPYLRCDFRSRKHRKSSRKKTATRVERGGARLHLRFVHETPFIDGIIDREQLICAFLEVEDIKSLFAEYVAAGVEIADRLKHVPWGGSGFTVRDPDGNPIYFVWQPPIDPPE